ncbi:unnamed protein product, partial [Arabidopsis halleri]
ERFKKTQKTKHFRFHFNRYSSDFFLLNRIFVFFNFKLFFSLRSIYH